MNPFPHIRHVLRPFVPFLATEAFNQPGPGLLLGLALGALLLVWLLGVV